MFTSSRLSFKIIYGYTFMLLHHLTKGDNLCNFLYAFLYDEALEMGSAFKGKNLILMSREA